MKIVYFAHSLLSRGGDKMVLAHAGWLAAHGHKVELCCNVVDTVLDIPEGVQISKPYFSGTLGTILSAFLQRWDANIVLASIIPMACFLFPQSRRKVVYFAQDYDESYYVTSFMKNLVRFFYRFGLSLCHIPTIAVSHPLADLLRKLFNATVVVAENGVDTNMFYPDTDQDMVTAKCNRRAVLLLSRSDRRKGFDIARAVIGRLRETYANMFEVWTVGESCTGIFDGIVHRDFGYVGEERLRQIMSSADMFLYPSRHEGFPLMVVEAFACKCPVVTTTAVPYARHEENALVGAVGDVSGLTDLVSVLLRDENKRRVIIERGSRFAAEHSLEISKAEFEEALKRLWCKEAAAE
jgi:glycosyltransferase involved in cell wall biosynthesis